jgi:hypothetical protein
MKHAFLLTLILCSFLCLVAAQTVPLKEWDARFGGGGADNLFSLQQTTDGGYILAGYSKSGISGDKTQASRGGFDYWMVKTNSTGVKQWDVSFGGTENDFLFSIQQTADGGYILGGYSESGISGDKTQDSQGGSDYWIVKADANGIKQWDARFGGSDNEELYYIQQTSDGGYMLGGSSFSGSSGDKTQDSQGGADYWIVKTDANGIKQWDARFGGTGYDYVRSIQQTIDGGFILGGHSVSEISGDITKASEGGNDYWIVKTNANGVIQWDARFGGSADDYEYSVQQTTDGGYILGGQSNSGISGDKTQDSQGDADYWILKTDGNGVKQWDARFGGSQYEYFASLQQTTEGGYILSGYSHSGISGDKTQENRGPSDYWIVKTDADGEKQWDAEFGGSQTDNCFWIQQTTDGGYILGGNSTSGISGDKTQDRQGGTDYWILKLSEKACPIPANLSSINIMATSVKLSWTEISGVSGYKVRYKIAGSSGWTTTQSIDDDKTLNDLMPNAEYAWQVKSICGISPIVSSEWSEKHFFETNPLKLSEPEELKFEVYPNPVAQTAIVSFFNTHETLITIELMDVSGRFIKEVAWNDFSEGTHQVSFDRGSAVTGVYFIRFVAEDRVMVQKIVFQ